MDKSKFVELIQSVAGTFRQQVTDSLLDGYWMGLSDLTLDQLNLACHRSLRACEFMPTVKELRELAGQQSDEDRAVIAFREVEQAVLRVGWYKSPDFEDKAINATIRNLGGWQRICDLSEEEFDKWFRKDFERVYGVYSRRGVGDEDGASLEGEFAKSNRTLGYHDNIPTPLLIESTSENQLRIAKC